jgi:phage/plasmid-like protein (TIGR03299 family)
VTDNVETAAVVGEGAWHNKAVVLKPDHQAARNVREFILVGGMDWRAVPCETYATIGDGEDLQAIPLEVVALLRDADKAVLGVNSKDYEVVHHQDYFQLLQPLLDDGTLLRLESIGALRGGRTFYLQARYGDDIEIVPGDPIAPFLLLASAYDGKLSNRILDTDERVVCENTLRAAGAWEHLRGGVDHETEDGWSIPHRGGANDRIRAAVAAIQEIRARFDISVAFFRKLATIKLDTDGLRAIARKVFADERTNIEKQIHKLRRHQEMNAPAVDPAVDTMIATLEQELAKPTFTEEKVMEAWTEAPGAAIAAGTAWGGINAITYHLDHGKRGSAESRLNSSWFGPSAIQRKKAMSIFGEMAGTVTQ